MLPRRVFLDASRLFTRKNAWRQRAPQRTEMTLWEPDKRSGYPSHVAMDHWYDPYTLKGLKESWTNLRRELRKARAELYEYSWGDAWEYLQHGDCRIEYDLRDKELHDQWIVTADSDYGEGKSTGKFVITQHQTGIFSGVINTELIKDGRTKAAGYANIRTPVKCKSFNREDTFDWTNYTHLLIKVRGDGRNYMINLNMRGPFDVQAGDNYNYPLYTRGGPYWQTERIPFSKFFFTHKGRIQDKQAALQMDRVKNVSFTAADGIDGPFQLEIDYIGVEYDQTHTEEFAYELYESRPYDT